LKKKEEEEEGEVKRDVELENQRIEENEETTELANFPFLCAQDGEWKDDNRRICKQNTHIRLCVSLSSD
jgi:hypothetical protein